MAVQISGRRVFPACEAMQPSLLFLHPSIDGPLRAEPQGNPALSVPQVFSIPEVAPLLMKES